MAGTERRLAAILCLDVVGWSSLVERDEAAALDALRAHRAELLEPAIGARAGRIFKATGDGLLAEFASVVAAVQAARAIQAGMAERNRALPPEAAMRLRIGLNLGDVVVEDGDVLGHGVNLAARLQALAEPGGICVSGPVADELAGKVEGLDLEPMGEVRVKGVDRPIRAFRVRAGEPGAGDLSPRAVLARAAPGEPPPLSLVVLPFRGETGTAESWLADAVSAELTARLARRHGLFLIAPGTARTYKDQDVDPREVGRELGVRYLLDGRIRRRGERLRLTAELIDAGSGQILWAQALDRDRADLELVEEEVAAQLAATLRHELVAQEAVRARRKAPHEVRADDLVMQAWALLYAAGATTTRRQEARRLFEAAAEIDPGSARAWTGIAYARAGLLLELRSEDREGDLRAAEAALGRARALVASDVLIEKVSCALARVGRDLPAAEDAIREALRLDPGDLGALAELAQLQLQQGRPERYFEFLERALRTSPSDPARATWLGLAAVAAALLGRLGEAVDWAGRAIALGPSIPWIRAHAASALARSGRHEEARAMLAEFLRLSPIRTVEEYRRSLPSAHPEFLRQMDGVLDGLRLAGLPASRAAADRLRPGSRPLPPPVA